MGWRDNAERIEFDHGIVAYICLDEDPQPPSEWENPDYFLGRTETQRVGPIGDTKVHYYKEADYAPGEDPHEGFETFPVELCDYGAHGAALRFCADEDADGAIFVRKHTDLEWLARVTSAEEIARSILGEWNQYLQGDVWGYRIIRETKCGECGKTEEEDLDSCYGFYGHDLVISEAKSSAKYYEEKVQQEVEIGKGEVA